MRVATIFEDSSGEWRWNVRAGNGEIIAQSEGYTRKADAERGLNDAHIEYDNLVFDAGPTSS